MIASSVRVIDPSGRYLSATINGVEWSGIPCRRDGDQIVIVGDGQIAEACRVFLAQGGAVTPFAASQTSVEDIVRERNRRLAIGFDYDFGDARGVHRIGTTPSDMIGWGEVSTYAGALLDSGDTTTTIAIVTDTGPCSVTSAEWRAIEIAAAVFRQPIWSRAFELMRTMPADYASDARWV